MKSLSAAECEVSIVVFLFLCCSWSLTSVCSHVSATVQPEHSGVSPGEWTTALAQFSSVYAHENKWIFEV